MKELDLKTLSVTSDSVKVSRQRVAGAEESIEIKFDGIYKNGSKIL